MFSWKITTTCLIGVAVRALAAASCSSLAAESAGTSATAAAPSASIERIPCMRIPPYTPRSGLRGDPGCRRARAGHGLRSRYVRARKMRVNRRLSVRCRPVVRESTAQPIHDVLERRPGREQLGHAELLQHSDVLVGDDAAAEDHDVRGITLAQLLDNRWEQRHVRTRVQREPDDLRVFLQ